MKYKEGQLITLKSQFGTTHPYKYELARALENIPERGLSAHVQILRYDSYKIVPFLRTVVNLRYITPVEEYINYLKEEKSNDSNIKSILKCVEALMENQDD